jgi:hypothetical protein
VCGCLIEPSRPLSLFFLLYDIMITLYNYVMYNAGSQSFSIFIPRFTVEGLLSRIIKFMLMNSRLQDEKVKATLVRGTAALTFVLHIT